MRNWNEGTLAEGTVLLGGEGFIVKETPDDDALTQCKALGKDIVI